jgi:hypothetical protein
MKEKVVTALQERGSRRGCGAEPPSCEPPFKQPERKADTMKAYLLKNAVTVETKAARKSEEGCMAMWVRG